MRFSTPAICAAVLLATPAAAQNVVPIAPVTGVIQSFDGKVLTIKAADGSSVAASLAANAPLTVRVRRKLADIKPGDFVASGGTRGPDGKIHANEIRIIAVPTPSGEGQFPMSEPGQVMTNATVKQIMTDATVKQVGSAGGIPIIKLTFHGAGAPGAANCTGHSSDAPGGVGKGCIGETEYDVPANVPVMAQLLGDGSMLKPGARASMNLAKNQDGSVSAVRVTLTP